MKIGVFTDQEKRMQLQQLLQLHTEERVFYESYDDFIEKLPGDKPEILIVARDGADGMESVRAAKILQPDIPVIWFSDDKGFGPESYRVGCTYFSAAPISEEIVRKALKRCRIEKA